MNVIENSGKKYGKIYLLSDQMETQYREFEKIWELLKD
jgi:hypothetical protein